MSDCSAPEIIEAYNAVRNDADETNWMLITYAEGSQTVWALAGKGTGGIEEMSSFFTPDFIGFGYLRVISGDELSKRPKFVFIRYIGKSIKMIRRSKITLQRGDVEKVINQISVAIDAESAEDCTEDVIMERVQRAGGAHYGNSSNINY